MSNRVRYSVDAAQSQFTARFREWIGCSGGAQSEIRDPKIAFFIVAKKQG